MMRKNRKPWFGMALAAFMALILAACSGPGGAADSGSSPDPTQPGASTAPGGSLDAEAIVSAVTNAVQTEPIVEAPAATSAAEYDADTVVAAYGEVLSRIYETALPSVVRIEVEQVLAVAQGTPGPNAPRDFRRFFDVPQAPEGGGEGQLVPRGEGSGFVWSEDGHVVTNWHVVDGADRVVVIFADGYEYEAAVLGTDPDADLAVLKIDAPSETFKQLALGDSSDLKVGQLTAAIGAPFGLEFTMTRGIVSALGRTIAGGRSGPVEFRNPQAIQTDAPINPGNSGGPLLDRRGQVIGINSQIVSRSGSSSGVGFAVPINTAKRVVPELIEHGKYEYAYLGISGTEVRDKVAEANGLPKDTRGVLVVIVTEGGPAEKAGVVGSDLPDNPTPLTVPKGGDVITAIDGLEIKTMEDLIAHLVENNRPGDRINLKVLRDGEDTDVSVTLGARPDPSQTSSRPS